MGLFDSLKKAVSSVSHKIGSVASSVTHKISSTVSSGISKVSSGISSVSSTVGHKVVSVVTPFTLTNRYFHDKLYGISESFLESCNKFIICVSENLTNVEYPIQKKSSERSIVILFFQGPHSGR